MYYEYVCSVYDCLVWFQMCGWYLNSLLYFTLIRFEGVLVILFLAHTNTRLLGNLNEDIPDLL